MKLKLKTGSLGLKNTQFYVFSNFRNYNILSQRKEIYSEKFSR